MPDYQCFPLWHEGPRVGNVDPEELPLSDALKHDLDAWAERYDATLCPEDPARSGFPTPEDERAFEAQGVELWRRLRAELGASAHVRFLHRGTNLE